MIISPYSHHKYTRTPIKVKKTIPANFPLGISDAMLGVAGHGDAIFDSIQSAGEDLRAFSDAAMQNELALEILDITPGSNVLHAYLKNTSSMAANDYVFLRTTIAGGETAPAADSTFGSEAVWSAYDCVVHGSDVNKDAANNVTSVTTNASTTKTGGDLVNGWPAEGYGVREGTATTNSCDIDSLTDADLCSFEFFVFKDNTETTTSGRLGVVGSGGTLLFQKLTTDDLLQLRQCSGTNQFYSLTNGQLVNWFAIQTKFPTFTAQPAVDDCRFNGAAPTGTNRVAGTGTRTAAADVYTIMNRGGDATPFDGRLAEFRYRLDNVPDNDWATAFYDGFNDPTALAEAEAIELVTFPA